MTTARVLLIVGMLAAATIAGALATAFAPGRVVLTGADLDERFNRTLPRQFHNVSIDRATVDVSGGRIAMRVEVHAAGLGRTVATAVAARGVPHYDGERGEVFFDAEDVRIEDAGSGGVVSQLGIHVGGIHVGGARVEAAADGLLARAIKAWLAARPVYRFKDDFRGTVLRAVIDDVAVDGDRLVIRASLIRLTAAVAGWLCALVVVVALGAALVAVPDAVVILAAVICRGGARKHRPPGRAPPP